MVAYPLIFKYLALALLAVLPVQVQTNSGQTLRGDLLGFTEDTLRLDQGGSEVEVPFDDVARLIPTEVEEETGPTYRVTLVGGSKIQAQDVRLTDSEMIIEPRRQNPLRIPVKQVKAIRFRAPSDETDAAWLGNLERESRGDALVIRRPGNRLDPQQGVVLSIQDGKVGFDLDDTVVNAPIDRLEGVIFGGTALVTEDADVQVIDVWGSEWSAVRIDPSQGDQPLQLQLTESIRHEVPLYQVVMIRWSGGVAMLPGLDPVSESLQTYFETGVDPKLLSSFFGSQPVGEQNLRMFGGSNIEYRIEPGYRLFAGSVRRDGDDGGASEVTVRLRLDSKVVWEESLKDLEPKGFELPVGEARRLAIEIDSGRDGDLGDRVLILRPRLLK